MTVRLADRLRTARRDAIVGRDTEKALFMAALTAPDPPFCLLSVLGPGGIGKSTLLHEFSVLAAQAAIPAIYLDSRNIDASPDAFLLALATAFEVDTADSILDLLTKRRQRTVLLIDTYERLAPLDGWLREVFLPQLSDQVMVVLAGRNALPAEWRMDAGWRSLIYEIALRNLSALESQEYLRRRGVNSDQQKTVLRFTHGHPLALSLVADVLDQRPGVQFEPADVPDMLKALLEQFVQKVPGPAHRVALEACALVRVLTEGLLASMLSIPDAHELFDWLRSLSFIEASAQGIFPHDLARDTLVADLRWRNPDWYAELHRRARSYYSSRLQQVGPTEQQQVLYDYVFLHRDNQLVRPFYEWQGMAAALPDSVRPEDFPALTQMVTRYEGEASAQCLQHWLQRQPEGFLIYRGSDQEVAGFVHYLALHLVDAEDEEADPAVGSFYHYLEKQMPLREGEIATLFRFWMSRESYQDVSPIQSQIFINMVRHYLTTPSLAYTFIVCADPSFWKPVFTYADLSRLPALDFTVGSRRYGVYGHDWRRVPPIAWLDLMGERELGTVPVTPPEEVERMVVLEISEFANAVQDALKQLLRPLHLRGNPLLRSRLVVDRVGMKADEASRVAILQTVLRDSVDILQRSPKEMKFYRALYHTYLQPATTQEAAAELLDLPFSTYRRHLKSGIERVIEVLWQQEIAGGN